MKRLTDFFNSRAGTLLLFSFGVLLFSWPLLSVTADKGGPGLFHYLFFAWAAILVTLIVLGVALGILDSDDGEN